MRKSFIIFMLLLSYSLCFDVAKAQQRSLSVALNWQECIQWLEKNNSELRSAKESLKRAQQEERLAFSGYLPTLSVNLSRDRIFKPSYESPDTSYEAYLELNQNLFSGFADQYKMKQNFQNELSAHESLKMISSKLTADLKKSIAQWMYATEVVRLSEKILERRSENIKNVQIRYKGGSEHLGSVKMAEAYLLEAKVELQSAQKNLEIAKSQLKALIGIDEGQDIIWSGDIPNFPLIELKNLEQLAMQTAEYRQAIADEKSASLGVDIAEAKHYPSVDLSARIGRTDSEFFPQYQKWSVGLTLSWYLFSGGRDDANLEIAKSKRVSSQFELHSKSQAIISKILQAHADLELALEKIKLEEKFRDATQLRAEIAEKKYINGILTFDDWDSVESDLIQHQKSVLSSYLDRRVSETKLESLLGQGVWQ